MNEQQLQEIEARLAKMQAMIDVIRESPDTTEARSVLSSVGYDMPHYYRELIAEMRRLREIETRLIARWQHVQREKNNPVNADYVDGRGTAHMNNIRITYAGEQTAIIMALGYVPEESEDAP